MSIDIKTATIEPLRITFEHLKARLGEGKVPTRYQEAVHDIQAKVNFHYRPTWDPEREIFDVRRTALKMEDFDKLVDPRQYYYGTYTIARSKQQEAQEANFEFVEKRGLVDTLPAAVRERISKVVLPLRHVAWAANNNNCFISAYGYGTPFTSAAIYQSGDNLGVAQYISRIGLILGGNDPVVLREAKQAWMESPDWQPLRRLTEDSMVVRDWFELHVLQNFVLDGLLYPLVFDRFDREVSAQGGAAFSMLCEFMGEWAAEAARWTDATMKVAAAESADNRALIAGWVANWTPRVRQALAPVARIAFGNGDDEALDAVQAVLRERAAKAGVAG